MTANGFSVRPLYLQLRDALAERISSGEWQPEASIPNEGDLARAYGVSPGTIRKALDLLEKEHVLTRKQGRGTFVNDQGSDELATRFCNIVSAGREPIATRVELGPTTEDAANELECARLGLRLQDRVYRILRSYFHEERPLMVEEASVPAELFPDLLKRRDAAERLTLMAQQYRLLPGKTEELISVRRAKASIAEALKVAAASPVLVLDRVTFDLRGRAIEWRVAYCNFNNEYYLVNST
jgi:GntR family transcriptional regulator